MVSKSAKQERQQFKAPSPNQDSLLWRLQSAFDKYPTALVRAAQYILENPEKVIHQSLSELSTYSESGQASIVRLCQELGFDGFTQFKIALSADVALRSSQTTANEPRDALGQLSTLLSDSIARTYELLDPKELERAAKGLAGATRIDLFGSGVSGMIANLLGYRLLRLGCNANATGDPVLAHEISAGLGRNSAAIAVSQSGETPETLRFLRFARDAGAFTVAITCFPKSPLAKSADVALRMARLSQPTYGGPISDVPRAIFLGEALAITLEKVRRKM